MFRLFLSQIKELEDLHKQVDGLKYSVHASSILDVDDMADHVQTLSLKNKVSLPAERRDKRMCLVAAGALKIYIVNNIFEEEITPQCLVYTYRQRHGFFVSFKNGFSAVLWYCLQVTSKRSKVPHTKTGTLTVCVNKALIGHLWFYGVWFA